MTDSPSDCLPHRSPFLFLSSISEVVTGQSARGQWSLDGTEDFFKGHFPANPVVPGVLITEAMAQIAGVALFYGQQGASAMIAHIDVRFRKAVNPPATILLSARCQRSMGSLHLVEVSATVGSSVIAQGQLSLTTAGNAHEGEDAQ